MWRREVDQKMARLMTLRDTLPQEVKNKFSKNFFCLRNEFLYRFII
jgi:hypothetical protein